MKKPLYIVFWIFAVLLFLFLAAGILELFGISLCFFGLPLHGRLAIPICFSAIGFTVCACRRLRDKGSKAESPVQYRLLSAVVAAFCCLTVLISVPAAALTSTAYADSRLSADKEYKIFFETDAESDEPIVHLYKRYSSFLMVYRNSAVLYDFSGALEDVAVSWSDTECRVEYPGYMESAESADDLQVLTRRIRYGD